MVAEEVTAEMNAAMSVPFVTAVELMYMAATDYNKASIILIILFMILLVTVMRKLQQQKHQQQWMLWNYTNRHWPHALSSSALVRGHLL